MEDKTGFTCDIQTTNTKPNYSIYFHNGEKQVGRLDFNGPSMVFEGDAEDSAKLFMDFLAQSFHGRLNDEFEKGKKECAALNDQQAARIAVLEAKLATARKLLTDLPSIKISQQPEWNYSENNGEIWWYFLSRYCKEALAAISETQPETLPAISFNRNGATMAEFPSSKCQFPKPASAEVEPQDLQIDTFVTRLGSSGWSPLINNGIRITHKPTGVVVEEFSDRSQHRNRAIAIEKLKALLAAAQTPTQQHRQESKIAWIRVIDEAMVCSHLGVANPSDTYEEAKKKLNLLITHEAGINEYFNGQVAAEALEEAAEEFPSVLRKMWAALEVQKWLLSRAAQKREAGK